jgi:hypothetical protein
MWKVSPKTPHTQFLCRFQFYKLPLKTYRVHYVHSKIEPLLLLFQISFVGFETTYYNDNLQKIVW